jgi:hypothetical protein
LKVKLETQSGMRASPPDSLAIAPPVRVAAATAAQIFRLFWFMFPPAFT